MNRVPPVPEVPEVPVPFHRGRTFGGWLQIIAERLWPGTSRKSIQKVCDQLAEAVDVDPRSIDNWLKDIKPPLKSNMSALMRVLTDLGGTDPWHVEHRDRLRKACDLWRDARSQAYQRSRSSKVPGRPGQRRPYIESTDSNASPARVEVAQIAHLAPQNFVGRVREIQTMSEIWAAECSARRQPARIIEFAALGGEGKSALVAHWIRQRQQEGWSAASSIFAWSFFSQGSRDQATAAGEFMTAALRFFGESDPAFFAQNDIIKGRRLARLLDRKRCLLILDGLEPLQFPPSSPSSGSVKDDGIKALLEAIATNSAGLCIATSRLQLTDLRGFYASSLQYIPLPALSPSESVQLLMSQTVIRGNTELKLKGRDEEFVSLAKKAAGHALSLSLLASYLILAHGGDIRKSDVIEFRRADEQSADAQAFRIMAAYVRWYEKDLENGAAALSILRILGLFDRPADAVLIQALTAVPKIPGFTDTLVRLGDDEKNVVFSRLASAGLIKLVRDDDQQASLLQVDAHPLIREFFADELEKKNPQGFRLGHERLYTYLCNHTADGGSSREINLLYQAVLHGCKAGHPQSAFDDVYWLRISRGKLHYSLSQFGAVNDNLAALAGFFQKRWEKLASGLNDKTQAQIRSSCGFLLRTAGRFPEAAPLIEEALKYYESESSAEEAAAEAGNLTVLYMNAGRLSDALRSAELAVKWAKRSDSLRLAVTAYAALGDVLVQRGRRSHARALAAFRQAEKTQRKLDGKRHLLYSTKGYRLFELLLDLGRPQEVLRRISICEKWTTPEYKRLDSGLYLLMKGRAQLALAKQRPSAQLYAAAKDTLEDGLVALIASGFQENIVRGLLALVDCLSVYFQKNRREIEIKLDEAWEISGRGPMLLFRADILIARATLFGPDADEKNPWPSRYDDFIRAEKLVRQCGYGRRQKSLQNLRLLAKKW